MPNERPITFSAPMVRAILEDRKTQTRRVLRPQPVHVADDYAGGWACATKGRCGICDPPYRPGGRLWVRETFCPDWLDHGALYKADGGSAKEAGYAREPRWTSPLFMPRSASRITLEIEAVRVERLQEISEDDAIAEGCPGASWYDHPTFGICTDDGTLPSEEFRELWRSLHRKPGKRWEDNPFVAAITFRRIDG